MNLKKALIASMLASSFGAIALPAQAQVIVDIAPPPLQYEVVPVPRAGYVWEQGYWRWNGRRHVWRWRAEPARLASQQSVPLLITDNRYDRTCAFSSPRTTGIPLTA